MEEEIEDGGVIDGFDLVPAPVVPGSVADGPLGLHGGGGGRRGEGGEGGATQRRQRAKAPAEVSDQDHRRRRRRRPLAASLPRTAPSERVHKCRRTKYIGEGK